MCDVMKKIFEKIKYHLILNESKIMFTFCALVCLLITGGLLNREIRKSFNFNSMSKQEMVIEKVDTLQIDSIRYKN